MPNEKDEEIVVDNPEAGEEEVFDEASKEIMEEIQEMEQKKEAQESEEEQVTEEPTVESKEESTEEPVEEKPKKAPKEKPKRTYDLAKLNEFKERLVKDFGLEEKTNQRQRTALKFNGKSIIRLIPRKRIWFAVKHYDHAMKRVMYYKVTSDADVEDHYKFVKFYIKNLQEQPAKEEA